MSYRVCIPTAGTGSRLGGLTTFVNKSLVSVANRPILSHVIEKFPADAEFVIALGHKSHLVKEYLELAYPQRRFFFCDVSPFEGAGSGLGLSLLSCQQHLQQPFIFISCDTLVTEPIPPPFRDWMACADVGDLSPYRTLELAHGQVTAVCEKGLGSASSHKAYIGLAGIHGYQVFWQAMNEGGDAAIHAGEAHGLRALLNSGITAHNFSWYDTGNLPALARARAAMREADAPNILEKTNEAIWFVGSQVVKFSDDTKFIANRVKRVGELKGFVPNVDDARLHMYRYPKVDGRVMSEVVTVPLFSQLLDHCNRFWERKRLGGVEEAAFLATCMRFYRDKTLERVALFYEAFNQSDGRQSINGIAMPPLAALLEKLDWKWVSNGIPGRFHGDFHFENILWNHESAQFTFLDWRQDFGGDLSTGDIYYDLAKMLHGLIVNHELIAGDFYEVDWQAGNISFDLHRKQMLVECERYFNRWLDAQNFDRKKVRVLTALIYLNIAALHHYPYSLLLYALGKSMLAEEMT